MKIENKFSSISIESPANSLKTFKETTIRVILSFNVIPSTNTFYTLSLDLTARYHDDAITHS